MRLRVRPASSRIPRQRGGPDPRTIEGLFRGRASDRVPALIAATAFALVAPLGAPTVVLTPAPPVVAAVAAPPRGPATVLDDMPTSGPEDRRIALTFDDGPDPRWTPEILAVLARHGAVGTFCMVGSQMERHPELVRQVVAAGMRICAHSRTHDEQLSTRDTVRITDEILDVPRRAVGAGDVAVSYFRAPGGYWSPTILDVSSANGMRPLGWSVDPRDWKRPGADAVVTAAEKAVHPGAVVLLHDGGGNRQQTVDALDRLLPALTAQGYTFTFP
ncbi:MAG: polysaccharide deacetylase family protein [Pseudonocardia sp.]|nr:polysaccharide deacetylase family protein [Pseudonocardia sp.]